ncbi:prephenate dehydrogenase/arogenate dehydrogenase family protein [Micromonospora tarensis]|uniref:Prephenate dehydrogenase/arogenate dehydrogenase family protein n=1 Tax=Micromonospora tarensis TaxID=2806100 RepID=A0ABS1YAK8_9ACTN|nr:prephenate dehydrogenase/arogenate dehydrogenase family protein [Micromonospora tarensis]MBM0274434.1 prephenate dehydrogenase/arogenate dehydrogenase family protein [Micromonospora tarensis]
MTPRVEHRPAPRRCVVVGGAGAVGGLLADLLAGAGAEVCLVDRVPPVGSDHRHLTGDITALSAAGEAPPSLVAELAAADTVVLAVPEQVALTVIGPLLTLLAPGSLLVDTLSVKSRIASAVGAGPDPVQVQVLSINPMFAPSLGLPGRPSRRLSCVTVHEREPCSVCSTGSVVGSSNSARPSTTRSRRRPRR